MPPAEARPEAHCGGSEGRGGAGGGPEKRAKGRHAGGDERGDCGGCCGDCAECLARGQKPCTCPWQPRHEPCDSKMMEYCTELDYYGWEACNYEL
mmetsp:Transcript_41259/g.106408  ORF Transcript_41259/g.106408 Transcript_41259/m.106408 type:complete len:95 (-) Transcript_41259:118-402(-)